MDGKDLLIKLSEASAVSGDESKIHGILNDYFSQVADKVETGKIGNFVAFKKGSSKKGLKVMIAAHADEIGLMVKHIDKRGFIHFTTVGGVDLKTLPAQEVIIHGKEEIFGVIGAKPPHVLSKEDRKKAIKMEDMTIDTGLTPDDVNKYISIGDFITIKRKCANLLGDYITGKALDNRASIAAMYSAAKYLKNQDTLADVYYVATSMEEIGAMGAAAATYDINPDLGIAIDVTFGDKYVGEEMRERCGDGIEIAVGPNMHPYLTKRLIDIADKNKIPYFLVAYPGCTGTDAWDMQTVREGIPMLLISIPIKFMHTSTEVVDYKDVERAGRLMSLFISSFKGWEGVYDD